MKTKGIARVRSDGATLHGKFRCGEGARHGAYTIFLNPLDWRLPPRFLVGIVRWGAAENAISAPAVKIEEVRSLKAPHADVAAIVVTVERA